MKEIVIREAIFQDAPRIAEIVNATWQTAYRGIVPDCYLDNLDVAAQQTRVENRMNKPYTYQYFVAVVGGVSAGFAVLTFESEQEPGCSELQAIYVLDEYQGCGIGRKLVEQAFEISRGIGKNKMVVSVLAQNAKACGFYERLGAKYLRGGELRIDCGNLPMALYVWDVV